MQAENPLNKHAERNIKLYPFTKIFTKRVFVPLLAVYFIEVAGFTHKDIGILATFYSFICLISEVPTGYFADKFTRVMSMRLGAILLALSTLFYVFLPTKPGIFGAIFVEAIGLAFISGAGEAMIHDTLVSFGRAADYVKILSKSQSFSLLVNAVLVALVPMTYMIDKRLPFIIGGSVYSIFFVVTCFITEMPRPTSSKRKPLINWSWLLSNKRMILWVFLFGAVAAIYWSPADFTNLTMREFGFRPDLLGWIFSASSLLGAVLGSVFHKLGKLKPYQYAFLDAVMMVLPLLAVAFHSYVVLGASIIISLAFWRFRKIIYQDLFLQKYKPTYKATVLSALSNAEQLNQVWLPILIVFLISQFGLVNGQLTLGLISLTLIPLVVYQTRKLLG